MTAPSSRRVARSGLVRVLCSRATAQAAWPKFSAWTASNEPTAARAKRERRDQVPTTQPPASNVKILHHAAIFPHRARTASAPHIRAAGHTPDFQRNRASVPIAAAIGSPQRGWAVIRPGAVDAEEVACPMANSVYLVGGMTRTRPASGRRPRLLLHTVQRRNTRRGHSRSSALAVLLRHWQSVSNDASDPNEGRPWTVASTLFRAIGP